MSGFVEHQFSALMNRFFYSTLEEFFLGRAPPLLSRPKINNKLLVECMRFGKNDSTVTLDLHNKHFTPGATHQGIFNVIGSTAAP
jgi:hypothetical protein